MILLRYNKILIIVTLLLVLTINFNVYAFIHKEYSLKEIVNACSNIVFGKITMFDKEKMFFIIDEIENVKGKKQFKQIKTSFVMGQGDCLKQLIKNLKTDIPIVIFYVQHGEKRIESIGYFSGMWIRLFAICGKKEDFEWYFTHTEKYMKRTFDGDTLKLQSMIRENISEKNFPNTAKDQFRILCCVNAIEYLFLSEIKKIDGKTISYKYNEDITLSNLDNKEIDLLWIGNGKLEDSIATKQKLENFIKRGGIVVVNSQEQNYKWIPEFMTTVKQTRYHNFRPTDKSRTLFLCPNKITTGDLWLKNLWKKLNKDCLVLATNEEQDITFAMVKYGKGMCFFTSILTERSPELLANAPMFENLLNFIIFVLNS